MIFAVSVFDNTLLERVCIRLNTCHEYEGGFMHVMHTRHLTLIKCHSLSSVTFNAKMTLFDLTHNKDISNSVIFALKNYITE